MIGNQFKAIVGALMIGWAAVSSAGCDVDGELGSIRQESSMQFLAEADTASNLQPGNSGAVPAGEDENSRIAFPTYAETRHFAIYNLYRFLTDSSGGSGNGASENTADGLLFWGGKLIGTDYFSCLEP